MTGRVPDNFDLYDAHERAQAREEANLPHCDRCGEPIYEDYAFRIDGELICERCIDDMRVSIDY